MGDRLGPYVRCDEYLKRGANMKHFVVLVPPQKNIDDIEITLTVTRSFHVLRIRAETISRLIYISEMPNVKAALSDCTFIKRRFKTLCI